MIIDNKKKLLLATLLVINTILFITYYRYPWHPDHYSLGQYTNTLVEKGYAPWTLHPASLFGYYPLSTPSGFEFFFAVLHSLSLIDLKILFYLFSIIMALFITTGVYLLMREFNDFEISFITSFILSTSVYFVKNLSNTASSRMFNMMFYPLFILMMFKTVKIYNERHKISYKYIIVSILLFILMNLIHRFGQISIIFVISLLIAILFVNFPIVINWIKNKKAYNLRKRNYNHSRLYAYVDIEVFILLILSYFFIKIKLIWVILMFIIFTHYFWFDIFKFRNVLRSEKFLLLDIVLFVSYLILAKIIDLVIRGRLVVNIINIFNKYYFQFTLITILIFLLSTFVLYLIIRKFKNFKNFIISVKNKTIKILKENPNKLISIALLILMSFFISRNFTGDNFYRYGLDHYTKSFILEGESPWVIMINFMLNLNNNITILIFLAAVGIVYIFLKDNKTFYDYFFMFVALGFSQFLLDWEYIRLYIIPIYAIFIGIGLAITIQKMLSKINKNIVIASFIFLFIIHLIVGNIFIQREIFLPKLGLEQPEIKVPEKFFINSGAYLSNKGRFSILSSSSIDYDLKTAYYAKKVIGVLAQSVFVPNNLDIEKQSLSNILESFKSGEKITEVFKIRDQIYGGYYYFGRYIYNLNGRKITDPNVIKIINLYKIRYVVDGPDFEEKTEFFNSIKPIKNKIYSSEKIYIYDLRKGRA